MKMLVLIVLFEIIIGSLFSQTITVECRPQSLADWTGRCDLYWKYSGEIKCGTGAANNFRGWSKFDISDIHNDATIEACTLKFWVNKASNEDHDLVITRVWSDPVSSSWSTLWYQIANGTWYAVDYEAGESTGYKELNLNPSAELELQYNVNNSVSWFAVGFWEWDNDADACEIDGWDWNGGNNPEPILIVEYSLPPDLCLSPSTIDLGSCGPDHYFNSSFVVENCGGGILSGNISESISWITSIYPSTFNLDAGQIQQINFSGNFPQASGYFDGYINISSNGGDNDVYVYGNVLQVPDIDVYPTSLTITQQDKLLGGDSQKENILGNKKDISQNSPNSSNKYAFGCIVPDSIIEYWETHQPINYEFDGTLAEIDWSSDDSPVKDQGLCGSCWAFAATAYIENLGQQNDLSEQVVVSCVTTGNCNGGFFIDALQYYRDDGVPHESCYPYIAQNGDCGDKCNNPSFHERITQVSNTLWGIATVNNLIAQLQNGPLVVRMLVPDDGTFMGSGYSGGIYNYNGSTIPNSNGHAILLVGYNDTQQYFKAKNSWGTGWGESGYFRIAYDDVTDDVEFGSYAVNGSGIYTQYLNNTFTISNVGNGILTINSITDNKSWLSTSDYPSTPFNISAGNSQNVVVSVDWQELGCQMDVGILTINSNDPNEPIIDIDINAIPSPEKRFQLKVFLEGPYNANNGLMTTELNPGKLPYSQPFNIQPWNYDEQITVSSFPNNVVDWILIEILDIIGDPSTPTSITSIGKKAGFLTESGNIIDVNGNNYIEFNCMIPNNNMYAIIWHRNHLGILSNNALIETDGTYSYDFTTDQNMVFGGTMAVKELAPGIWGMAGGDADASGQIDINDKTDIWNLQSGESGYLMSDFNLDTQVDNLDKNEILYINNGFTCQVPGYTTSTIFEDDFESYNVGSFPSSWVPDGNGTNSSLNYVDDTYSFEGNQSLKLYGTVGGCWGALAYHSIGDTPPYFVEFAIRNGNENLSGCHPERGDIGLRNGTHWSNPERRFMLFDGDGKVYSGGGIELLSYDTEVWYLVKIKYEIISGNEVKLSYWVNNNFITDEVLPIHSYENQLDHLQIVTQEGSVWFDNIKLYKE